VLNAYGGRVAGDYGGYYQGRWALPTLERWLLDHGLGAPLRQLVQDGVVNLLQRLHVANGGYVRAIVPTTTHVAGKHDEQGLALLFAELQGNAPAIAVSTGEQRYTRKGDVDRFTGELEIRLVFLVNSLRSRVSRLEGDVASAASATADPGIYVMMEHAAQLLAGQTPGASGSQIIKPLDIVDDGPLESDNELELWQQSYRLMLERAFNRDRDLSLVLKQINTYHRLSSQQLTDPAILEVDTVVKK